MKVRLLIIIFINLVLSCLSASDGAEIRVNYQQHEPYPTPPDAVQISPIEDKDQKPLRVTTDLITLTLSVTD